MLEDIFDDIIPDAIKIGMLFNSEIILKNHLLNVPPLSSQESKEGWVKFFCA